MSSFSKLLKTTTSSILFKNSGANAFFKAFSITLLAFELSCDFWAAVPNQWTLRSIAWWTYSTSLWNAMSCMLSLIQCLKYKCTKITRRVL